MPFAQINDTRLYYEVRGSGPPVLFIHGGMGGTRSLIKSPWSESMPGFRCVFYDRRGCGRSDAPIDGYSLSTFAADAAGILNHVGISRAAIVATSAGGPIALQLAADFPALTLGLVLADTAAMVWPDDDTIESRLVHHLLGLLEAEGAEASFEARPRHARHSFEPLWRWPDAHRHGWLENSIHQEEELALRVDALPRETQIERHVAELRTCQAFMGADQTRFLGSISCPALIVHGETDAVVPLEGSHELAKKLPFARLVTLPKTGHAVLDDQSVRSAAAEFILGLSSGDGNR